MPRLTLAALLTLSGLALAQHPTLPPRNPISNAPPPTPKPTAPTDSPAAPLSGPSVAPSTDADSIVAYDFEGRLQRPEGRPEVAALARLDLTPEERQKTDAVLTDRAAAIDAAVRGNLDLLVKGISVRQTGDPAELRAVMDEYQRAFAPVIGKGQLSEQLAAVLPEDKAERLRELMRGYWRAVYDDAARRHAAQSAAQDADHAEHGSRGSLQMRRVLIEEATHLFGQEVKDSYDRIAADGQRRLEQVIATLDLTPEQDAKVRNVVTQWGQKVKLNPTQRDKADLFRMVMAELTPDQRRTLVQQTLAN